MMAYLLLIKWDEWVILLFVYGMTLITIFTNTNNGHPVRTLANKNKNKNK